MPTAILPPQISSTTNGKYGHETTNGAHELNGNEIYSKDATRPIIPSSPTSTPNISGLLGDINTVLASSFLEQYSEAHEYM